MFRKKKYFLKSGGAFLIAVIALIFAAIIFILMLPHLVAMEMVALLIVLIFVLIWIIIYLAMCMGAAVHHYVLPIHAKDRSDHKN